MEDQGSINNETKCSVCGLVSKLDVYQQEWTWEGTTMDLTIGRMQTCGHGYLLNIVGEHQKELREEELKLQQRYVSLVLSKDASGYKRTLKKLDATRRAWRDSGIALLKKCKADILADQSLDIQWADLDKENEVDKTS